MHHIPCSLGAVNPWTSCDISQSPGTSVFTHIDFLDYPSGFQDKSEASAAMRLCYDPPKTTHMGGWLSLIACLQRLMKGWCRLRDRADDQCMSPSGMLDAAHVIKSSQLISVILGRENVHGN